MKKKVELHCIFPTTIYKTNLDREFSKKEIYLFNKINEKELRPNTGNQASIDSLVLEKKPLKNLKKELLFYVKDYMQNVLKYEKVEPYITQSWLNTTYENQYHHQHAHPNSFISGVLYIEADPNVDGIEFIKRDSYQMISPSTTENNIFNSSGWTFNVSAGQLYLFPSNLTHRVLLKKHNNRRTSLAFNTFLTGEVGLKERLEYLKLWKKN